MEKAILTGKPVIFENTGPVHAGVVIEVMLAHSTVSFDIVSGCLDRVAWEADSLQKFLDLTTRPKMRILLDGLQDGVIPDESALNDLKQNSGLIVKHLPKSLVPHICVGDRKHVRLELKQSTSEASVTFGDSVTTGPSAVRIFDRLWDSVRDRPALVYGMKAAAVSAAS